jgi:hypothetical protein
MDASHKLLSIGLAFASLAVLSACASSGQGASGSATQTAAEQAGAASRRHANAFVLTAAEIASAPSLTNAYDAVQQLRPSFLRMRGSASRPPSLVAAGAEGQATGRRPGQVQGATPAAGSGSGRRGDAAPAGTTRTAEDPGVVVYLERQRYGRVDTLREIPIATVEEIRFLNVGEANSQFGMGHPHGVIQVILRRGPAPQ